MNSMAEVLYEGFCRLLRVNEREVVQVSDSVGFLIHITDSDELVFVSQQREPMISSSNPEGRITEVPAGRFDCGLDVQSLVAMEAGQEVGATISPEQVQLLNFGLPLALSPGIITERMYLAYVPVHSSQLELQERIFGLAEEGEQITRVKVSVQDISTTQFEDLKTAALAWWFLLNRLNAK